MSQQRDDRQRKYKMNDAIYITGKCHYASITEPNTKFEPVWSIQVEVNDDNRPIIEKAGLSVANKGDDRGDFVTIKRKVLRKDGTQRQGPVVKDSQNNNWDGKLIANGSTVNVKAVPFEWSYAGKSGVSADLAAVQVVDFIEYSSAGEDFDVVEGGYVTETSEEDIPFAS
jgi:ABC-type oligopeptide transport system substrate-binding subunit